jgi:hypothetical protein
MSREEHRNVHLQPNSEILDKQLSQDEHSSLFKSDEEKSFVRLTPEAML